MNALKSGGALATVSTDDLVPVLEEAVNGAVDTLLRTAIRSGVDVTWPTWTLDAEGQPSSLSGGHLPLYDGDAGVAWALLGLAAATGRADARELGRSAMGSVAARASAQRLSTGLLDGRTGVDLALHSAGVGWPEPDTDVARDVPDQMSLTDLTSGLAGMALAAARQGVTPASATRFVQLLAGTAAGDAVGLMWADPDPDGHSAPLCGLAHGASGVALALAELQAGCEDPLPDATALIAGALRWESTWFSAQEGGWPDLRRGIGPDPTYPTMWCHGAAGIGAARLRLLVLARSGRVDLGVPLASVQAEAEVAIQACGRLAQDVVGAGGLAGGAPWPGGLTLCHGLGGPLDVLVTAYNWSGVREHLDVARQAAAALLAASPEDPALWPSGLRNAESLSFFNGLAGSALVLARLAWPDQDLRSPSMLFPG